MATNYEIAEHWEDLPLGCVVMDANGCVGTIYQDTQSRLRLQGQFRFKQPQSPFAMILDPRESGQVCGMIKAWEREQR